jgi:hypothetical protein
MTANPGWAPIPSSWAPPYSWLGSPKRPPPRSAPAPVTGLYKPPVAVPRGGLTVVTPLRAAYALRLRSLCSASWRRQLCAEPSNSDMTWKLEVEVGPWAQAQASARPLRRWWPLVSCAGMLRGDSRPNAGVHAPAALLAEPLRSAVQNQLVRDEAEHVQAARQRGGGL